MFTSFLYNLLTQGLAIGTGEWLSFLDAMKQGLAEDLPSTYRLGRALQLFGLLSLPFSLWVGFLGHNESGSLTIFLASVTVFYAGYLLTRFTTKL